MTDRLSVAKQRVVLEGGQLSVRTGRGESVQVTSYDQSAVQSARVGLSVRWPVLGGAAGAVALALFLFDYHADHPFLGDRYGATWWAFAALIAAGVLLAGSFGPRLRISVEGKLVSAFVAWPEGPVAEKIASVLDPPETDSQDDDRPPTARPADAPPSFEQVG